MNASAHRFPIYGLVVAVAMLLALGLATEHEISEQEDAARLVEHTHLLIEALQRIPSGIGAAESSLRGYTLQNDERFLVDFEPAIRETEEGFRAARTLSQDPDHKAILARLEPKIHQRLDLFRERLQAFRASGDRTVVPAARMLSQEIRGNVSELVEDEARLLEQRSHVREQRLRQLRLVSPLGLLASVGLVGVAFLFLSREVRQRRIAESAAAEKGRRLGELLGETEIMLELGELLSACLNVGEANRIVADFGPRLFPNSSGAVCMLAESQNLLEPEGHWSSGERGERIANASFAPDDCWALRRGRPHHSLDGRTATCGHVDAKTPTLCIPLSANGQVIGILQTTELSQDRDIVERRAIVIGDQLAMALANLRLRETLKNQSIRDALTGLFNRRYTDETFARELHRAAREEGAVSLVSIDVDFFKKFNDVHGHQAGDRVLSQLGVLLRKSTRGADVASRMGGEELAILMPGACAADAAVRAEEIRRAAENLAIVHEGRSIGPVTLSIGIASFPHHGAAVEEIIRAADAALYRAKHEGRNRVVVAELNAA